MKKTAPAAVVAIMLLFQATPCTGMELRRAVVYEDLTVITFDAACSGTLTFEAPADMIPDSLVVTPLSGGLVQGLSMEPSRTRSGAAGALGEELERAQSLLALRKRELALVDRQIEAVSLPPAPGQRPAAPSRTQAVEALRLMDELVPALNRKAVDITDGIRRLEARIEDLKARLDAVNRGQGWLVRLRGEGGLRISYAVRSASRTVQYRMQSEPDSSRLVLEMEATIRQATGMDWEVGELLISTGRPSQGIQAPELTPWHLSRRPEPAYRAVAETLDAASLPASAGAQKMAPEVEATAASYILGAAKNVHIRGDGTPETVLLARRTLRADFSLLTVPKLSERVYLRSEAIQDTGAPLVQGRYLSFVDGVFSGSGDLARVEPGGKMTVDLGAVEWVLVSRREVGAFHEKTLTGRDRTTCVYEITLENTRDREAEVLVKDQVPISRDEEIEVRLLDASPKASPDKDGILTWDVVLGPRQKTVIRFSFSITGLAPRSYR
jgi:uncharacterized protein (TIGR02231 family)